MMNQQPKENVWTRNRGCGDLALGCLLVPLLFIVLIAIAMLL